VMRGKVGISPQGYRFRNCLTQVPQVKRYRYLNVLVRVLPRLCFGELFVSVSESYLSLISAFVVANCTMFGRLSQHKISKIFSLATCVEFRW
jgi:hypothetical protein